MKSSRPLPHDPSSVRSERTTTRSSKWRRILPGGLALALIAGACTSDDGGSLSSGPDSTDLSSSEISLTSGLQTSADCPALLDELVAEGLERVGPYGFNDGFWGFPIEGRFFEGDDMMMEDEAMEESAADFDTGADSSFAPTTTSAGAGAEGDEFSGTNNQEIGVDEPDLVKTDGERLVIANGNQIRVLRVGDGAPELERTIRLDENVWANELFLNGDTVLVMSNGWTQTSLVDSSISLPNGINITQLTEIDISTGDVVRAFEYEGNYLSARDVDGTARIVLSAQMGSFPFVFPSNDAARDAAETANRSLIENSTIEQWLPNYRIVDGSGSVIESGPIVDCDRMHLPSGFSGFGTLAVLTIDLDEGLELMDSLAVLTDGQTIYASPDRLAVATNRWPEWDPETGEPVEDENTNTTSVHSFDISDPSRATYTASGSVRGFVLNQFSMSEHEGLLRIATTETPPWNNGGQEQSESFVTVLGEEGGVLETIGQVGGLGKGEQIFSVRFIGDTAYVVTFRQVDPLYTVDLSEPTDPTVLGELKIPGFSTYLHPIDDGRLLGVGQDADENGFQLGAQISSFDVADLTNPTRTDQLGLGENSYSGIDWDKKAFLWWAPTNTAFVPVSWWNYDEVTQTEDNGAAVVVVDVNDDGTLVERGRVEHPQLRSCEGPNGYTEELISNSSTNAVAPADAVTTEEEPAERAEEPAEATEEAPPGIDAEAELIEPAPEEDAPEEYFPEEEWCWTYAAEIRRSVIVGDQLLTISETGIKASSLDDLSNIGWVSFDR